MKITQLDALKQTAQRAKGYVAKMIGELSSATLVAIQEMEQAKADRTTSVTVIIPDTGWAADSTWPEYPLCWDIAAPEITAEDCATVALMPDSLAAAAACGLCPACETQAGRIRLWAQKAPDKALAAAYRITQGTGTGKKEV